MVYITLRGTKWPAMFDLQNVRELQDHYGGDLAALPAKMADPLETAYIAWLMIREGVAYQNDAQRVAVEAPTLDMVRRLVTYADLTGESGLTAAIEAAFLEFWGKNLPSLRMTIPRSESGSQTERSAASQAG